MVLLWEAALLAILGAAVCLWAGSSIGAASFGCQAVVDLVLAWWTTRQPWNDGLAWRLRFAGSLWLFLSIPNALAFVFTSRAWDHGKLLGTDPGTWIGLAALSGLVLWLASAGGIDLGDRRPFGRGPSRLGRVATIALVAASMVPIWPIAGVAATVEMGGCAPAWLVPSDPFFCVRSTIESQTMSISGETSLPDGSIVTAWINDSSDDNSPAVRQITVRDGHFSEAFDLSQVRADRGSVVVEFQVTLLEPTDPTHDIYQFGSSDQPQAVVDRYGVDGARMVGPTAVWERGPLFFYSVPEYQVLRVELEFGVPQ